MILYSICVAFALVVLYFYLEDMQAVGPSRKRRVARERQEQAYIEYSKAEREHMRGPRYDLIIHDEIAYMQDIQEEKQYDILGWTKKPLHDCDDSLIDDCGPDCE